MGNRCPEKASQAANRVTMHRENVYICRGMQQIWSWRVKQHCGDAGTGSLKEKTKPEGSMEENIYKEGKQLVRGNRQRIFVDRREHMQGGSTNGGLCHGRNFAKGSGRMLLLTI